MVTHPIRRDCRPRGLTLVEVLLASVILAISAASILAALTAGHQVSVQAAQLQQAHMLASNLMQEIQRFQNFEAGDYGQDEINGTATEAGESCAGARSCFDDKTDFEDFADGSGVAATGNTFVDYSGQPLTLFTSGQTMPAMYRRVNVYLNDLNGAISDFDAEQPFLEVHVVVYRGAFGAPGPIELVRLRRIFGSY